MGNETQTQTKVERVLNGKTVTEKYADVTLRLIEEHGDHVAPLTPEHAAKVKRKLYLRLMGLLSMINIMLFIDKSTLGYAAILGLFEETGISQAQYNNLNTMFYVGYLAFLWPGHYLMQRLPFGKFVAGIIFSWAVVIFLHCVATRYAGLIVLRLALGAAEGVVVPAIEITIGIGPVLPWKLLHVVTGGITLLLSIWVWFDYPNNPAEARFLTLEEKVHVVRRVHESQQSSIEQKQFKRSQFIETMKDPVSWLFALQAFTLMYCNNLTYGQKNLLVTSLGVTPLESTLVAVAGGGFGIINCVVAAFALRRFPGNFALHCTLWCLPAIAGGIGMVTVPWDRTISLLACMFLAAHTYGVAYIIALGWTNSSAAGYTKKLTRNVMFMIGYSAGNLVSPQIWVPSARPRYYGAWASMIVVSWFGTPVVLWVIHFILARRNKVRKERLAELSDQDGSGYVEQLDENGQMVKVKVEVAMLDLTDLENENFIYPL
ncbi:major facilitator superfamily domain-containing protein [Fusarium solani]|uniref:Major facilitator superfamily domain-containing protein n=1 Tax=Fusarium solani TaxID=169388 RepID=A0A9P9KK34_FUSSL|nr:major facilitator superfamily domain-containing protein [Fusarium solani]KAH7264643.1 major facilitator superfamily domain-containing protein [Fusarium solani]